MSKKKRNDFLRPLVFSVVVVAFAVTLISSAINTCKETTATTTEQSGDSGQSCNSGQSGNSGLSRQSGEPANSSASATSAATIHYELAAPRKGSGELMVEHTGYSLSYNTTHNCPNWVAWQLTAGHTDGTQTRSTKFWADPAIPQGYRVDYFEYKESGYDRGHMCPAGDNKWSREAMHDCFYMSNMCPQVHELNAHSWEQLESKCRQWAREEGSVYIVCGPVWKGTKHETIGITHRIDVPEGFFKAVLSLRKGHEKMWAYYYTNTSTRQPMTKTATTVDALEAMTGLDLFYQVNPQLQEKLEKATN